VADYLPRTNAELQLARRKRAEDLVRAVMQRGHEYDQLLAIKMKRRKDGIDPAVSEAHTLPVL
jgi:hypothetical protein